MELETVFANTLYSAKEFGLKLSRHQVNLLMQHECRLDRTATPSTRLTSVAANSRPHDPLNKLVSNEKITKSTTPCIINQLNLKFAFFCLPRSLRQQNEPPFFH